MEFQELISIEGITRENRREEEIDFNLTDREVVILTLLCHGRTYKQTAPELFIALTTVKTHINVIFQKLGVIDKAQAVVKARQYDLIKFSPERCTYGK